MHLTPEEAETVSRLRRLKAGEPWEDVHAGMTVGQMLADNRRARNILLRLLPEDGDSEMPVTEQRT